MGECLDTKRVMRNDTVEGDPVVYGIFPKNFYSADKKPSHSASKGVKANMAGWTMFCARPSQLFNHNSRQNSATFRRSHGNARDR
jgi:hypothetical protein